ncbi:PAP2-domain-containing protein [Aspergillus ellipticus CBS 707.79]|uniref:PAP2-domain-containing protein n=1 Tax=Aspergillus ellipticus CBS 707.79 TaxID=1448320 RepID=A0A319CS21_9EURO|nr:PAP2-domain-containing protein [Aspergillus ellipticus CBS 707.79]
MTSPDQDSRHFSLLSNGGARTSKRLVFSYVLDWVVIIVLAIAGAILYKITGSQHAFSLDDPNISYPLTTNTVSIVTVGIVAFAVPAVVIAVLSLLVPGPWNRRLWEWHAGWLGLGLSLAGAFFITSGLKDVVGKPRPDLLARCQPDLTKISTYAVGGLGLQRTESPVIVSVGICTNTDTSTVKNGFASFPSGHSSFSWSGLLYLSLWLGAKFAVTVPAPPSTNNVRGVDATRPRQSTAAPPLYLLVLVAAPVAGAVYICGSRYSDYMHAGWDILGGSIIGIAFAILGFFWYHAPSGPGWAWGARSRSNAFGVRFGARGFGKQARPGSRVDGDGYEDVELGAFHDPQRELRIANP